MPRTKRKNRKRSTLSRRGSRRRKRRRISVMQQPSNKRGSRKDRHSAAQRRYYHSKTLNEDYSSSSSDSSSESINNTITMLRQENEKLKKHNKSLCKRVKKQEKQLYNVRQDLERYIDQVLDHQDEIKYLSKTYSDDESCDYDNGNENGFDETNENTSRTKYTVNFTFTLISYAT